MWNGEDVLMPARNPNHGSVGVVQWLAKLRGSGTACRCCAGRVAVREERGEESALVRAYLAEASAEKGLARESPAGATWE